MNDLTPTFQLKQQVLSRLRVRNGAAVACGVVLMTLSAKAQIPFWPVPMTLHTLAVMGIAVACGPIAAVSVMASYLIAGASGLPVFSGSPERGLGLAYMVGPTGGYLLGFLIASGIVGHLAAGRRVPGQCGAMLAGLLIVYASGLLWLSLFVPAPRLLAIGVAPFLLGDLLKIGIVAAASAALSSSGLASRLKALAGL